MTLTRKEKIGNSFGEKVAFYNKHAFLQRECAQKLCELLPNTKPLKILEIGCGTGFLTEELQKKYPQAKILGIDISKEMVSCCSQKFTGYHNLSFQKLDGESFKLSEKFDLIVTNLTVQWFQTPSKGLQKLCKNLNNNGRLFFSTLGNKSFQEWGNILNGLNLPSGILPTRNYTGIFYQSEKIVPYKNAINFLQNLKKIGAHQPREGYRSLSQTNLRNACKAFDTAYQGNITWHILYGCLDALGRPYLNGLCESIQPRE